MRRATAGWSELGVLTRRSRARTALGVVVAVVGPALGAMIVDLTDLAFPSLPFIFMILLATLIGRRIAGVISVVLSTILLDYFFLDPLYSVSITADETWALGGFAVLMLVTAQLIAWLDDIATRERTTRNDLALMVELGDALAEAADVDVSLSRAADVLAGRVADWVVVALADEDRIRTVAASAADGTDLSQIRSEVGPLSPDAPVGVAKAVLTGQTEVYAFTDAERARRASERDERVDALVAAGAVSIAIVPLRARGRTIGAIVFARGPSSRPLAPDDVPLLEQAADRVALVADNAGLVESERRTARLNAVLQDLTGALSGAVTVDDVARTVVRQGVASVGASAGVFCIRRDEDTVEMTESFGYDRPQIERFRTFSLSAPMPMSEAMRTTRPVILGTLAERDARYPALRGVPPADDHTLVCLPLVSRGRAIGGLVFNFAPPRPFRSWEIAFLQAVAHQAAQALDRAELYVRERATRAQAEASADRLERLLMLAYRLSRSWDRRGIADAIVEGGVRATGADAALLQLVDEAAGELVLEAHEGYAEELLSGFRRVPVSAPFASGEAARSGHAVWIGSREDWREQYPAGYDAMIVAGQTPLSTAALPLLVAGRRLGVVSFGYAGDRAFTEEEKDFLLTLAGLCAQALQGVLLLESREEARADAERARDRVAFLSEATRLLSSSLDYERTIVDLAQLCVPDIADWVSVSIVQDHDLRQVVLAHRDPARVAAARAFQSRYPFDPNAEQGLARVLRTGESELYEAIDDDVLKRAARDPEALDALRSFGLASAVIVPIGVQDRVLGAMTLAYAESGRRYDADDLAMAESVGRRAAVAIENARLFHDREHMSNALQRSLLPQRLPAIPGAELAVRYIPFGDSHVVGGDFYDAFEAGEDSWGLLIGDVCGKGPEAASIVGIARHTVRGLAMLHSRPSGILHALNRAILEASPWDRFCTTAYVRLHRSEGAMRATVSLGGHLPPIVRRASGDIELIGEHGSLLGVLEEVQLSDAAVDLRPGDALVMYTDGFEERPGVGDGTDVGSLLRGATGDPTAEEIADLLVDRLVARGQTRDDAAVLVLRVRG